MRAEQCECHRGAQLPEGGSGVSRAAPPPHMCILQTACTVLGFASVLWGFSFRDGLLGVSGEVKFLNNILALRAKPPRQQEEGDGLGPPSG